MFWMFYLDQLGHLFILLKFSILVLIVSSGHSIIDRSINIKTAHDDCEYVLPFLFCLVLLYVL